MYARAMRCIFVHIKCNIIISLTHAHTNIRLKYKRRLRIVRDSVQMRMIEEENKRNVFHLPAM